MSTTRPRAVLFDCDGVIVDSETMGLELLQADLAAHGLAVTMEDIHKLFVGGTIGGIAVAAREMGAALPDSWVEDFYEQLYARLAEGVELIPGVVEVMARLDALGIPYAVGSNGTSRKMAITLGQHPALFKRLEGLMFSGQELGCPKPDPGLYLHAAAALGVAPEHCVVIDDSASGCRGGVAAGMRTLGFAAETEPAKLTAVGAEVFTRMDELPALLGL